MDHLRKRVGDLQMDKNFTKKTEAEVVKEEEEKPLLKEVLEQTTEKDFIIDCLCWHNEYRARHNVPAMSISNKLCVSAQEWANHLASRNELYYCPARIFNFGQNIFCCVETCLMLSISGQEVATYWYSSIKRYDFTKRPSLLHTIVNTGHFSQIVWKNTKFIGVGKSVSRTGKIFVVGELIAWTLAMSRFKSSSSPPQLFIIRQEMLLASFTKTFFHRLKRSKRHDPTPWTRTTTNRLDLDVEWETLVFTNWKAIPF